MTDAVYEDVDGTSRISQGSILRNLTVALLDTAADGTIEGDTLPLDYAVVMTQECDLEQDSKARIVLTESTGEVNGDKCIPSILVCPAYVAEKLRTGDHLKAVLGHKGRLIKDKEFEKIRGNSQYPRYHFLSASSRRQVPAVVVDFKHLFTVSASLTGSLVAESHIARLRCPYREDLSQRFASYLSRIGLPVPHHQVE